MPGTGPNGEQSREVPVKACLPGINRQTKESVQVALNATRDSGIEEFVMGVWLTFPEPISCLFHMHLGHLL